MLSYLLNFRIENNLSKTKNADVAELADALVLGTSVNDVGVQVPSSAPDKIFELYEKSYC